MWLPVTRTFGSNTLWSESSPGKGDFHPFECEGGHKTKGQCILFVSTDHFGTREHGTTTTMNLTLLVGEPSVSLVLHSALTTVILEPGCSRANGAVAVGKCLLSPHTAKRHGHYARLCGLSSHPSVVLSDRL